jgi:hypothetical protein
LRHAAVALFQFAQRTARHLGKHHQPAHLGWQVFIDAGLIAFDRAVEKGLFEANHQGPRDHHQAHVLRRHFSAHSQFGASDVVALRLTPLHAPAHGAFARLDQHAVVRVLAFVRGLLGPGRSRLARCAIAGATEPTLKKTGHRC